MNDRAALLKQIGDELVVGIGRFERRRQRRRRALVVAAVAGLVGLLGTGVFVAARDRDTGDRVAAEGSGAPRGAPGSTSDVAIDQFGESEVPAVLFATNGNPVGISVSDLDAGVRATYRAEVHTAGAGALSGAVMTADGEVVVWRSDEPALGYPAAHLTEGGLASQGRRVGTILGERTIVPTDDGGAAWILAADDPSSRSDPPLELVDLETGEVSLSTTVPSGSRLVDAIGDDAVIHPAAGPVSEVIVVSPSGDTSTVEAPEPASLVTATATHTVWIVGDDADSSSGDRLLVVPITGPTITVPLPAEGEWSHAGGPTIPSNSPALPTLTTDGTRLLVALTDPNDPNRTANRLADLDQGTADVIYEGPGASSAFWARDDRTAIVVSGSGDQQTVTAVDSMSEATTTIADALPRGYFVIAGR